MPQECLSKLCHFFHVVLHMFKCLNPTFNPNKKISLDKTGEGNVVLDLAISAQKYPKFVTQVEQIYMQASTVLLKTTVFSYGFLALFFSCLNAETRPLTKTKNVV